MDIKEQANDAIEKIKAGKGPLITKDEMKEER
jgi:hypothetical protein